MKVAIVVLTGLLVQLSAEANNFQLPTHPLKSGVVCSDAGIDVLATANSATSASVKISANRKSKVIEVQAAKSGSIVTYSGAPGVNEGKLEVNFDRTLPGSDAVMGELDMEFDGERIRIDIPCRLLFMAGKQPRLNAWQ
jgi:hypothetical protein